MGPWSFLQCPSPLPSPRTPIPQPLPNGSVHCRHQCHPPPLSPKSNSLPGGTPGAGPLQACRPGAHGQLMPDRSGCPSSPQWGTVHGSQPSSRALCTDPPSSLPCSPLLPPLDHSLSGPGLWPSSEATPSLLSLRGAPSPRTATHTHIPFIAQLASQSQPVSFPPGCPQIWVPLGSAWPRNCPHPLIQQICPADNSTLQFSPHTHSPILR